MSKSPLVITSLIILLILLFDFFNLTSLVFAQLTTDLPKFSSNSSFTSLTPQEFKTLRIAEEKKYFVICLSIKDDFIKESKIAIQKFSDMAARIDEISASAQEYYNKKQPPILPVSDFNGIVNSANISKDNVNSEITKIKETVNGFYCADSVSPDNFKDLKLENIKLSLLGLAQDLDIYKAAVKNLLLSIRDGLNAQTSSSSSQIKESTANQFSLKQ